LWAWDRTLSVGGRHFDHSNLSETAVSTERERRVVWVENLLAAGLPVFCGSAFLPA
jgi:hypothetical protein